MSAPTRGMVAGQPIQTQAQSKEFDAGYERTFGNGTKERGRFVVRGGVLVKVGGDYSDAERRAQTTTEGLAYQTLRATDGTDISTRKKHREYLKANGLAQASDYSPSYMEREAKSRERQEDKERREIVERDVYKVFGG